MPFYFISTRFFKFGGPMDQYPRQSDGGITPPRIDTNEPVRLRSPTHRLLMTMSTKQQLIELSLQKSSTPTFVKEMQECIARLDELSRKELKGLLNQPLGGK